MKSLTLSSGKTVRAPRTTKALRHLAILAAASSGFALLNAAETPLVRDADLVPGSIALANAARFDETFFDVPLTSYITGWRDPNDLEASLEFYAPRTPSTERFTYKTTSNAEEFYSETDEDIRAIGAEFKRVEYTGGEVEAKTLNKGLTIRIDIKQATPGWDQRAVAKLKRRLLRNELRRAIALLQAAAVNTGKTWDSTAGKDPDQDALTELIAGGDVSGISNNRIGYGLTAWNKRGLSLRAQNNAGGYASAGLTLEALAGILGVDQVFVSKERYQTGAATKTQIVGNLVLMFSAMSGADLEDPSNIKRFVSPTNSFDGGGGGDWNVYVQRVNSHLMDVTVEHNSLIAITSTLGIRSLTIS